MIDVMIEVYYGTGLPDDVYSRDNSDYWDGKHKEMSSHPDVGKIAVIINPDSEFYRKPFKVHHVDGDAYYLGDSGYVTAHRDDIKLKLLK